MSHGSSDAAVPSDAMVVFGVALSRLALGALRTRAQVIVDKPIGRDPASAREMTLLQDAQAVVDLAIDVK